MLEDVMMDSAHYDELEDIGICYIGYGMPYRPGLSIVGPEGIKPR